jgi:predicted phosphoadenosine phosphosulfate sulfurtransferase
MKIYKKINVYDAALDRLRYIFDEFENVVVGYSGGKDSTVTLNLAMIVAKEKNRLPLSVIFIDQEAEWQGTIDVVKKVMYDPNVKPYWFQMPIVITNNASSYERYSYCWNEDEKEKWIHPKDDISIKENTYGTERFHELFEAIFKKEFNTQKSCYLAGVRTEEAPKRFIALTEALTYKHITYGKILNKSREHYTLYPIYDWSYTDVWKAIHDNKWDYNKVYDEYYRNGVTLNNMRISNVHHETAIQSLMLIQEIEPKTWERVAARINGANTIKHLKSKSFQCPKDLPSMFLSWEEYAIHLANNIIQEQKYKDLLLEKINKNKEIYSGRLIIDDFYKTIIKTILSSDWDFTKFQNWLLSGDVDTYRRFYKKTNYLRNMLKSTKFLETHEKEELLKYFKTNK